MKLSDIISKGTNFGSVGIAYADGQVANGTLVVSTTNTSVHRNSEDTDEIFISTISKSIKEDGDVISLTLSPTSETVVLLPSDGGNILTPSNGAVMLSSNASTQLLWNEEKNSWLATELAVGSFNSAYLMLLTTSDTSATIAQKINAVPKDLGGNTLSIYFPNGTINLTSYITFSGFRNGKIDIIGNGSLTGEANTNQTSVITVPNNLRYSIYVTNCSCDVEMKRLKFIHGSGSQYCYGVWVSNLSGKFIMKECYVDQTSSVSNYDYGMIVQNSSTHAIKIEDCRTDGVRYGWYFYRCNNVNMTGCIASTDIKNMGIYAYYSNVTLNDCTIDSDQYGAYLYRSTLYLNDSTVNGAYRNFYTRSSNYYYI